MSKTLKFSYQNTWGLLDAGTQAALIDIIKEKILPFNFKDAETAARIIAQSRVRALFCTQKFPGKAPKSPEDWVTYLLKGFNRFDIDERLRNIVIFVQEKDGAELAMDDLPLETVVRATTRNIIGNADLIAKLIKRGRWVFTGNGGPETGREVSFVFTKSQTKQCLAFSPLTIWSWAILADYSGISTSTLRKRLTSEKRQTFLNALLVLEWDKYEGWATEAGIEKPQGITIEQARVDLAPLKEMRDSFQPQAGSLTRRRHHKKQRPASASASATGARPVSPVRPPINLSNEEIKRQAEKFLKAREKLTSPAPGGNSG